MNGDSNYVLVEVFPLQKESEAKALFLEINSAQPVKLIDLPGKGDTERREGRGEGLRVGQWSLASCG